VRLTLPLTIAWYNCTGSQHGCIIFPTLSHRTSVNSVLTHRRDRTFRVRYSKLTTIVATLLQEYGGPQKLDRLLRWETAPKIRKEKEHEIENHTPQTQPII
jgi:hypothetical protein